MHSRVYVTIGMLLMMMALSSCGMFSSKSDYDKVSPGKALEIPPDLDEPSAARAVRVPNATYSRVADGPINVDSPATAATPVPETGGSRIESGRAGQVLIVDDSLEGAWRRLGFALQRIGLTIEHQERDLGVYSVKYVDLDAKDQRPGRFSRWVMRKKGPTDHSGTYQIHLQTAGEQTRVRLLDNDGNRAAASVNEEILGGLLERLE